MVDGMSTREAARVFGLHRDTVRKMLAYAMPPGYRRQTPPRRPKLEPYTGSLTASLKEDHRVSKKQRHTARRIFERLRDEHGFGGQYTIVKDYVRERRRRTKEMFVPLSHALGHAQCDFGEARVIIGGVEQKAHYFVLDQPHSDGCFIKAYPAETTEVFRNGHVPAFAFLGGVPQSVLYDNTRLAVARILGDGRRKRTRAFTELQSHNLFEDQFGRPGKGNDKGKVEGMVGYVRRNFLAPAPSFESFEALNARLERRCLARMNGPAPGPHGEYRPADGAGLGRPTAPACRALRRLRPAGGPGQFPVPGAVPDHRYSVPVAYGHRDVLVKGYVDRVVISCGSEVIARHPRSTSGTTLSSTPFTTCRSWSGRRAPWIRRRPSGGGTCPGSCHAAPPSTAWISTRSPSRRKVEACVRRLLAQQLQHVHPVLGHRRHLLHCCR